MFAGCLGGPHQAEKTFQLHQLYNAIRTMVEEVDKKIMAANCFFAVGATDRLPVLDTWQANVDIGTYILSFTA